MFNLDDGTLGGSLHDVLEDSHLVEQSALELSLELNCCKFELIWEDVATKEAMFNEVPGLLLLRCSEADILGSPLGCVDSIGEVIKLKTKQLQLMGDRFHVLHSQNALLLLRHSFSNPKLLYICPPHSTLFSRRVFDCIGPPSAERPK